MTELLDQSEVNALLAAVEHRTVQRQPPPAVSGQPYDFQHGKRIGQSQLAALRALHETFAQNLGKDISGHLGATIHVAVANLDQLAYGQFIHSLPNPTQLHLLQSDPLHGPLCLEISPMILFPIIDRWLGGSQTAPLIPQRPLTPIEQQLARQLTDRIGQHLGQAWSGLTPVTFQVDEWISDPQRVRMAPRQASVVIVGFAVTMGSHGGSMTLCIPSEVVEAVTPVVGSADTVPIGVIPLDLRAVLGHCTITRNELMSLAVGDIITTDIAGRQEVPIQITGKTKFAGQFVQFRGKRAVRVTRQPGSVA